MPPLPRIRSAPLARLAERLRQEPAPKLARIVVAAEAMAAEIEPTVQYPLEWIAFRLTGGRIAAEGGSLAGASLLEDLGALVERLSWHARIDAEGAIDAAALAERWRVSRKTLDRYRRRGLPARRVLGANAKPCTVFSAAVVEAFERVRRVEIDRASGFTRVDDDGVAGILRDAERYARAGLSRNEAARRIAARIGRAHETVRGVLQRHDARATQPIFAERGPLSARERRMVERAAARWIDADEIARRLGRPRRAIARLTTDARAARLGAVLVDAHAVAGDPEALSHPAATTGLGCAGERDLAALLRACRAAPVPIGVEERARANAFHALVSRAAVAAGALPRHGVRAGALDRIETDLRWASRLKAELVRSQLALLARTLEGRLPAPLDLMRAAELWPLLRDSILAIAESISSFDPSRGGRLAAPAGLAVDRIAVAWLRARRETRAGAAQPRLSAGHSVEDWTRLLDPWQAIVEPPAPVRDALPLVGERWAAFLRDRFGWAASPAGGAPPRTLDELGGAGMGRVRPALLERGAIRAARSAARAAASRGRA